MGDQNSLRSWLGLAEKPDVHIKVDSGMSRQGFSSSELSDVLNLLKPHKDRLIGIVSHFANVEDLADLSYARTQLKRFSQCAEQANKEGLILKST